MLLLALWYVPPLQVCTDRPAHVGYVCRRGREMYIWSDILRYRLISAAISVTVIRKSSPVTKCARISDSTHDFA